MGYAFISYSSADLDKANAVRDLFLSKNIDCWMAKYDIEQNFVKDIGQKIRECSCFVLLLSNSAQNSEWVSREVALAIKYKKEILPIQTEKELNLNDEFSTYLAIIHIELVDKISEKDFGMNRVLQKVISFAGVKESEKKQQKENVAEKKQAKKEEASDIVTVVDKYGWKYVGQMKDEKYHGTGTLYYPGGSKIYEGNWVNGEFHGKGTMFNFDGSKTYEGDFINGKMCGKGTFYYDNGEIYEGNWVDGLPHGEGTYYWGNGDIYIGKWKNNKRSGWGTFFYADGRTEEHYYENDELKEVK